MARRLWKCLTEKTFYISIGFLVMNVYIFLQNFTIVNTSPLSKSTTTTAWWCDHVKESRKGLKKELEIITPCKELSKQSSSKEPKSAIVAYLTAGVADGQGSKIVFTATDYVHGLLALGESLNVHLTRNKDNVHKLLLLRDGVTLPTKYMNMLKDIGWNIGIAPNIDIEDKHLPKFARYKTVYTKISISGLAEYKCVLLLDADTLVVGNIDDLMSCNTFSKYDNNGSNNNNHFRIAGVLDYYHKNWMHVNTGSILYKPSTKEMNRVYDLTKDNKFMRRFESDQIFTNTVYNYRTNLTLNNYFVDVDDNDSSVEMKMKQSVLELKDQWGQIIPLDFKYNAQSHLEYQLPAFWNERRDYIKIMHFTQRKGWQCPRDMTKEQYDEVMPSGDRCSRIPHCACKEAHRWYAFLDQAMKKVDGQL